MQHVAVRDSPLACFSQAVVVVVVVVSTLPYIWTPGASIIKPHSWRMTNGRTQSSHFAERSSPPPPMLDHGWWVVFGYGPFDQSVRLPREQEPAVDAPTPSTDSALKVLGQRN